eukprot:CAMPEP_0184680416 /NCGR_PEP_ID=MMETSP0312-20130426/3291_1 /TAXON_ID=31354 /ORGANISM="Compsopogon coeruleus, Strain SAG 36.94" /LENGTH=411 /DNA_ID=CAMNT_0027130503 /DNA_START=184 /DNA_END=1423 /DNA_ORIENTATION=+
MNGEDGHMELVVGVEAEEETGVGLMEEPEEEDVEEEEEDMVVEQVGGNGLTMTDEEEDDEDEEGEDRRENGESKCEPSVVVTPVGNVAEEDGEDDEAEDDDEEDDDGAGGTSRRPPTPGAARSNHENTRDGNNKKKTHWRHRDIRGQAHLYENWMIENGWVANCDHPLKGTSARAKRVFHCEGCKKELRQKMIQKCAEAGCLGTCPRGVMNSTCRANFCTATARVGNLLGLKNRALELQRAAAPPVNPQFKQAATGATAHPTGATAGSTTLATGSTNSTDTSEDLSTSLKAAANHHGLRTSAKRLRGPNGRVSVDLATRETLFSRGAPGEPPISASPRAWSRIPGEDDDQHHSLQDQNPLSAADASIMKTLSNLKRIRAKFDESYNAIVRTKSEFDDEYGKAVEDLLNEGF